MRWIVCPSCGKERPETMYAYNLETYGRSGVCKTCAKRERKKYLRSVSAAVREAERRKVPHPGQWARWTDEDNMLIAVHCGQRYDQLVDQLGRTAVSIRQHINTRSRVYHTVDGVIRRRENAPKGEVW